MKSLGCSYKTSIEGSEPKAKYQRHPTGDSDSVICVTGTNLSEEDKKFIRYAIKYTLDFLLPDKEHTKALISVKVSRASKDFKKSRGSTGFSAGKDGGEDAVGIWINRNQIDKDAEDRLSRFRDLIYSLSHELVHAKQYLTRELVDLPKKRYRFRGEIYQMPEVEDMDEYYTRPYEIDAYGREQHLSERFCQHWTDLSK